MPKSLCQNYGQKGVAIPIQVGRSIFSASPYDRTVSETSELPNEG